VTRLAIFDLDGTLVDSRDDLCQAVNHALRTVGLPERSFEEVSTFVGEGARALLARSVAPHQHLLEPALAAWYDFYGRHLLDHTTLFPGIAPVLASARCALAVHTNKPGAMARRILEGLGVLERFEAVLGGDEAPRKPDPAGTLQLMAQTGARPEETVFIGDSRIDCETAAAAGTRFVAVTWGLVAGEGLAAAGATTFARVPADLALWLG
jgi:phosphoglycolate phosphatase